MVCGTPNCCSTRASSAAWRCHQRPGALDAGRRDARCRILLEALAEGAALAPVEGHHGRIVGDAGERAVEMTCRETPEAAASRDIAAMKASKSPPHWAARAGAARRRRRTAAVSARRIMMGRGPCTDVAMSCGRAGASSRTLTKADPCPAALMVRSGRRPRLEPCRQIRWRNSVRTPCACCQGVDRLVGEALVIDHHARERRECAGVELQDATPGINGGPRPSRLRERRAQAAGGGRQGWRKARPGNRRNPGPGAPKFARSAGPQGPQREAALRRNPCFARRIAHTIFGSSTSNCSLEGVGRWHSPTTSCGIA